MRNSAPRAPEAPPGPHLPDAALPPGAAAAGEEPLGEKRFPGCSQGGFVQKRKHGQGSSRFFSPTAESFGVSAQIGSGVVRGGPEARFHQGSSRVPRCSARAAGWCEH